MECILVHGADLYTNVHGEQGCPILAIHFDFIKTLSAFPVTSKDRSCGGCAERRTETQPQGLNRSKAYRASFREGWRRVTTSKSSLHLNPSSESVCAVRKESRWHSSFCWTKNERRTSSEGWVIFFKEFIASPFSLRILSPEAQVYFDSSDINIAVTAQM